MKCTCAAKARINHQSNQVMEKTRHHPCFSIEARRKNGRIHLPVAPECNISCNYCNRKFDCSNESRPGVCSRVLSPEAARDRYMEARCRCDNLKVVGIAGPGDALANWKPTRKTITLIKELAPDAIFCLSTNGLLLPELAEEILDLGVEHITVTVNCLNPEVGTLIYKNIRYKDKLYNKREGAAFLIEKQLQGIEYAARQGAVVKVNTVMISGINDQEIPSIIKEVSARGAFISNIMPLIPTNGSFFENLPATDIKELKQMRLKCQGDLQQMFHCRQCRADAVGMLGHDLDLDQLDKEDAPVQMDKKAV